MAGYDVQAARKAGYSAPSVSATQLLQRPAIQEEIRRQQVARLYNEALPAAVQTLVTIMQDEKAATGARVQAAKVVLDRTLGSQEGAQSKAPHEMSAEELQAELAQSKLRLAALESAKADQAKPIIEHESATSAQKDAQPIDWMKE
jgi:phage terminase small subunit